MLIKFICCDVFARIACDLVSKSPHTVDLEFLPMLAHDKPKELNGMIQERIDKIAADSKRKYEAVILGFGLCGNAAAGLTCPIPMIIPRAHDCCAIHMGGMEKFKRTFGDALSARWSSTGYFERCHGLGEYYYGTEQLLAYKMSAEYMGYVEKYGEENADYIWETTHPQIEADEAYYIKIDGREYLSAYEKYKADVESTGKKLITAEGSVSLIKALIDGDWDDERFLVVTPGKKIAGVYDMKYVMKAE